MDLFRSKKRDINQASLDVDAGLQKRHHGLSGSLDDLLAVGKDEEDCPGTASENTASESEDDDNEINIASKKQKAFAKISIKREKRKEKEQRKKTEKNLISMEDFLGKQTEFKMWLYEEKSKNAGEMGSPKLKAYFKQFVRLWNKKKLASKYYRCSTLPESPAPLTPKKFNFLSEEVTEGGSPLLVEKDNDVQEKDVPTSPFVTFGKTPPKVFRSKKFQLFGSSKDVALLSVAPLCSPKNVQNEKENSSREQYMVPKGQKMDTLDDKQKMPRGATPYKVSVFPWASSEVDGANQLDKADICSTATPPSMGCHGNQEEEAWPPPPTDIELLGDQPTRTNDSPQVPPPPPPRLGSLKKRDCVSKSPKLAGNYADPYDKLQVTVTQANKRLVCSDYQDPVDCVPVVKQRTIPEDARLVLQSVSGNDEPDLSLYCKPVSEKRLSKEELEELYAKPLKRAKKNDIGSLKERTDNQEQKTDKKSDLYNEIMEHINKSNSEDSHKLSSLKPDPDYETIEECLAKVESKTDGNKNNQIAENEAKKARDLSEKKEENANQKFATISRSKKMRVMAASTEKIYETYLSLGRKPNPLKNKMDLPKLPDPSPELNSGMFSQTLKQKSKSQPDISFSEGLQSYEINVNKDQDYLCSVPQMSSFRPVDNDSCTHKNIHEVKLKESDRAKSYEDGLRNTEDPGTPMIMATPSFDSLCNVTPLNYKSFSSQSLPNQSGSYESLSAHSHMSTSTSSSLSFGPDEKSGSLQSLQSEKSLSPVKEEEENDQLSNVTETETRGIKNAPTYVKNVDFTRDQVKINSAEKNNAVSVSQETLPYPNSIPLTPGKISALKHGIDLSVYLLKPAKQEEKENVSESGNHSPHASVNSNGKVKRTGESHCNQKLFDTQSRLAIKDKLSGVKTKVDQVKPYARKETERRHTVQTVQDITIKAEDSNKVQNLSNSLKGATVTLGKSKFNQVATGHPDRTVEPDSKRHCGEKKHADEDHYLETDLDKVITDKGRRSMRKSKSHSGFETGSSTVVTEIW